MEPKYGDWRIVRKINSGSFGTVYEIEKTDYGVFKAALKVITLPKSEYIIHDLKNSGMDDQSVKSYLEGEIEEIVKEFVLMSRLKGNSNIVSYEDHQIIPHTDRIAWDIYIRMELLTPLDEFFHSHPLTRQGVIQLGIDMCKALEQCRKMKIIHRDIKPSNILVSQLGDFKLGDFGVSRTVERTVSDMTQGQGTPDYMAPEIFKGQSYGSSVDIYSLGLVMYRLLNKNRLPFLPQYPTPIRYEDNVRARTQRLSGVEILPPCEDDTRLSEIVLKACAYEPSMRYSSPLLMRQDLETLLLDKDKRLSGFEGEEQERAKNAYNKLDETENGKTSDVFRFGQNKTNGGHLNERREEKKEMNDFFTSAGDL